MFLLLFNQQFPCQWPPERYLREEEEEEKRWNTFTISNFCLFINFQSVDVKLIHARRVVCYDDEYTWCRNHLITNMTFAGAQRVGLWEMLENVRKMWKISHAWWLITALPGWEARTKEKTQKESIKRCKISFNECVDENFFFLFVFFFMETKKRQKWSFEWEWESNSNEFRETHFATSSASNENRMEGNIDLFSAENIKSQTHIHTHTGNTAFSKISS